jgi:hypothetical protein
MKKKFLFLSICVISCAALISSCEKESTSSQLPVQQHTEPTPPPVLIVGQQYCGGIIFYIDNTKKHGLILAQLNQPITATWNIGPQVITYATATAIGWGRENTTAIINAQGQGTYAASICYNLEINGYDDWFLPSKEELNLLYQQKAAGKITTLSESFYWTSTETSQLGAWSQSFTNGANSGTDKSGSNGVCPIRSF